jgi:hypothetical protein
MDTTVKQPKKIGLNGKKYFGKYYFVAILADGKFYTERKINKPWELDSQYNESIKPQKKYKPVLGNFAYKQLDSLEFKTIDSILVFNKHRIVAEDSTMPYIALDAPSGLPSLQLANNNEKLIDTTSYYWTFNIKGLKEYNKNLYADTISSIDFDLSKGKYNSDKKTYSTPGFFYSDNTVGGFIFTTKPGLGRIDYLLNGIIFKNQSGKFEMIALKTEIKNNVTETKEKPSTPEPIKKDPPAAKPIITEIKDN